jgi:molybdopterin converting factor small subunit
MPPSEEDPVVSVSLPAMLTERVGNRLTLSARGETVREVISTRDETFPALRFHLCLETGDLRPFVTLFVNGQTGRYLLGLDTVVAPGAPLHILPSGPNVVLGVLRHGLTADVQDPCGVYIGTNTGQLFASADGGDHWRVIADYLPSIYSVSVTVLR